MVLALLWVPTVAAAAGVAGARTSAGTLLSVVAGSTIATLLLFVIRRRDRDELPESLRHSEASLWAALGDQPPLPGTDESPVDRLGRSMQLASAAVARRHATLKADHTTLKGILDAVPSPVLHVDAGGRVISGNLAAQEFFAERSPLARRSLEELFTQAEVIGLHASAIAGRPKEGSIRLPAPEGVRVYQVFAHPGPAHQPSDGREKTDASRLGESPSAVIMLRDITQLALAAQLRTDFVANASHELRTPLSSIRTAIETLADGAWEERPMRERLATLISNNIGRLEALIRDMLDLSRLESPEAPVSLGPARASELAASLSEVLGSAAAERRLSLAFELEPALEHLYTDATLLNLILKNLVENAIKFANEGSTVRIRGVTRPGARRLTAVFQVQDQGIGIPFGQQQRIFERFYQVDPARTGTASRRGTGLGLAIVKHAVRRLGGSITVDSVWKRGTTMTVELPDAVELGPSEPARPDNSSP